MRTKEEIKSAFTPKQKLAATQMSRLVNLQKAFLDLAFLIEDNCPENADRTAALRNLLQAKHMATQAVTHAKEFEGFYEKEKRVEQDEKIASQAKFKEDAQKRAQDSQKAKELKEASL